MILISSDGSNVQDSHSPGFHRSVSEMGQELHSPVLHRSVSDSGNPDFFDSDIDAFIAQMTVQPPPEPGDFNDSMSHDAGININTDSVMSDDISSLVIPPPPGESAAAINNINIVPPVAHTDIGDNNKAPRSHQHRRSNSFDTDYVLNFPKGSIDSGTDLKHSDTSKSVQNTHNSNGDHKNTHNSNVDNKENKKEEFDSPAFVSERLSNLLNSMPQFSSVREPRARRFNRNSRRTSSLKLTRSTSADIPKMTSDQDVAKFFQPPTFVKHSNSLQDQSPSVVKDLSSHDKGHYPPSQGQLNSESKIGSKYSRHLQRSGSFNVNQSYDKENRDNVWSDSSGGSSSGSSETLSSLKATLKSYRDFLLSKTNSAKSKEKNAYVSSDDETNVNGDKSSLKRSNSFTAGWLKRRGSFDGADAEIRKPEVIHQRSGSDNVLGKYKDVSMVQDKKTPLLLSQLAPRSKLRSSSPFSAQVNIEYKYKINVKCINNHQVYVLTFVFILLVLPGLCSRSLHHSCLNFCKQNPKKIAFIVVYSLIYTSNTSLYVGYVWLYRHSFLFTKIQVTVITPSC